mmetsp:Transcript_8918/g.28127  ORF Transcript_8918/g.28127 Transcript_8918/m.28127 type:complete len:330 (+) Transcript_8918:299-1288(+)
MFHSWIRRSDGRAARAAGGGGAASRGPPRGPLPGGGAECGPSSRRALRPTRIRACSCQRHCQCDGAAASGQRGTAVGPHRARDSPWRCVLWLRTPRARQPHRGGCAQYRGCSSSEVGRPSRVDSLACSPCSLLGARCRPIWLVGAPHAGHAGGRRAGRAGAATRPRRCLQATPAGLPRHLRARPRPPRALPWSCALSGHVRGRRAATGCRVGAGRRPKRLGRRAPPRRGVRLLALLLHDRRQGRPEPGFLCRRLRHLCRCWVRRGGGWRAGRERCRGHPRTPRVAGSRRPLPGLRECHRAHAGAVRPCGQCHSTRLHPAAGWPRRGVCG